MNPNKTKEQLRSIVSALTDNHTNITDNDKFKAAATRLIQEAYDLGYRGQKNQDEHTSIEGE